MTSPYSTGFLETISDVHFGGGKAYAVVSSLVTNAVRGATPPAYATMSISPGKTAKVIYCKFLPNVSSTFTQDNTRYWIFWSPGGQTIIIYINGKGDTAVLGTNPYGWGDVLSMLAAGGATEANSYILHGYPFTGNAAGPGYEVDQTFNNDYSSGNTRNDVIRMVAENNASLGPLPIFPGTAAYKMALGWGSIPSFISQTRSRWEALIEISGPSKSPAFSASVSGMGGLRSLGAVSSIGVELYDAAKFGKTKITDAGQITGEPDDRIGDAGFPILASSYALTCTLPKLNPARSFPGVHSGPIWLLGCSPTPIFHGNP